MMRTTTPILSLLIAVLLFVFFTHPEYVETMDVQKQIGEYQKATATYQKFSATLEEKLAKKSNRSAYEVERLAVLIPNGIDETQYLVDLEALAGRNNLLFGNTSVEDSDFSVVRKGKEASDASPKDELTTVDITFEVVGTYDQFKQFLRDLESSLTIFEVTSMSFTVIEGPFQQFKLTVRTYALPESN